MPGATWLGRDHLGSVTVATGPQGDMIGRRDYAPFGAARAATGDEDRYGFTGQQPDGSGMLRFQYRAFDAATGRWSSPDPLFVALTAEGVVHLGEANTAYAYVANRPTELVDPTGLKGDLNGMPREELRNAEAKGILPSQIRVKPAVPFPIEQQHTRGELAHMSFENPKGPSLEHMTGPNVASKTPEPGGFLIPGGGKAPPEVISYAKGRGLLPSQITKHVVSDYYNSFGPKDLKKALGGARQQPKPK